MPNFLLIVWGEDFQRQIFVVSVLLLVITMHKNIPSKSFLVPGNFLDVFTLYLLTTAKALLLGMGLAKFPRNTATYVLKNMLTVSTSATLNDIMNDTTFSYVLNASDSKISLIMRSSTSANFKSGLDDAILGEINKWWEGCNKKILQGFLSTKISRETSILNLK